MLGVWFVAALGSPLATRRWGLNVHRFAADPTTMAFIGQAARIVRMDVRWSIVEPSLGVYNFTLYDGLLAQLDATNIAAYLILDGANTAVIPASPGCPEGCSPATPATRALWVTFALATMRHFAHRGVVWEILNESNDKSEWSPTPNASNYAALALALDAARRADPSVAREVVVGPTLAGLSCWGGWGGTDPHCDALAFVRELADAGALRAFDAISVHAYVKGAPEQHLAATSQWAPAQPSAGEFYFMYRYILRESC
jgi:hypothetical protein